MGIPRALIASSLLFACGPGSKSADGPSNAAKELCVEPASPGGAPALPDLESLEPTWQAGGDAELGAPLDAGWHLMAKHDAYGVIVDSNCPVRTCNPTLVKVADGAIAMKQPLPAGDTIAQENADYPFFVTWLGELDGAIAVYYNIVGEQSVELGSTTHDHLALFAPDDLAIQLHATLGAYPEDASRDLCVSELVSVDADCDGDGDLVQHETCNPGECTPPPDDDGTWERAETCPASDPVPTHTVYVRGADGKFTPR